MSLESEITRISNAKEDIKTAIEQKGVDVSDEARIDDYADYVNQIGADEEEFTVRFYDFDGTIVAQYTRSTFINLSAMPANPTHAGLTSQGWNWSLADAKAYVEEFGGLDIGQMYCTTDGKTKLYISIPDKGLLTLPFYWTQTVASGITINWGDGSTTQSFSGTGSHNTSHKYSAIGDYVITVTVNSGTFSLGNGGSGTTVFKGGSSTYASRNMLKKVEFGTGITAINAYCFYQYYSLESVTFPNNIKTFNSCSFCYCYNLKQVTIPSGTTAINAASCISYCYRLVSISIPNTVKTIGYVSFQNDYALKSLSIPTSVTSIGGSIIGWSYGIKDFRSPIVTANTSYLYIGKPCDPETVDIPNGVTTIAAYGFQGCVTLKSITIPDSVTTIGTSAFQYCYNLKSITVPNGVKVLPANFVMYCYSLTEVNLPNTITATTANYSLAYCYSLDTVVLPDSLKTIGAYCFYNDVALSHITIPSGVTAINSYAFRYCYSLKSIYMMSSTPPSLTANAFNDIGSEYKIYVPAASVDTYKAATNWSTHASHIEAM